MFFNKNLKVPKNVRSVQGTFTYFWMAYRTLYYFQYLVEEIEVSVDVHFYNKNKKTEKITNLLRYIVPDVGTTQLKYFLYARKVQAKDFKTIHELFAFCLFSFIEANYKLETYNTSYYFHVKPKTLCKKKKKLK